MAVEGNLPAVRITIKRDSFGIWRIEGYSADGAIDAMGRRLDNALGSVVAKTVDHPFDVRGLAGAIELILGVKEAS